MTKQGEDNETALDLASGLAEESRIDSAPRLRALYGIGRALLAETAPRDVLRAMHEALVAHLRPDHACLLAVDGDGVLRPLFTHHLALGTVREDWPLSHTALERVRATGLAILTSDALEDPSFGGAASVRRLQIRSILCVPLGRGPVRGVVYLDRRAGHARFDKDDLEFAGAISVNGALLLDRAEEHARTTDALRRSSERVEVLEGELLRHQIVGRSKPLLAAYDALRRFARAGARVLLRGETGTGKELFARAYAAHSPRKGKPYIPVPIPALAPTLVESELFGHVRGAFTEASRDRKGRLELAQDGVLFLDEIGDVEIGLQAKLLRFLDSGELHRVGDNESRTVDVLVVSATNRPLERLVAEGRFRDDLLARLGQTVTIPPLRDRPEDIPLLVDHFLERHGELGRKRFAPETLAALQDYTWELNVRQLQAVVERAVCLVDRDVVLPSDLPGYFLADRPLPTPDVAPAWRPRPLRDVVDEAEREHIVRTLESTGGNKKKAMELLQVSSETLYRRIEDFGLRPKGNR